MKITGNYVLGEFIKRSNRFLGLVRLNNNEKEISAHIPDPGRLKEILTPEKTIYLRESNNPFRKTKYTLVAVKSIDNHWINLESTLANQLFATERPAMSLFDNITIIKREFTFGRSRFDFLLTNNLTNKQILLEIKSVTLAKGERALFPDAPTKRGTKHIKELIEAKNKGFEAVVLFAIKVPHVVSFVPNEDIDPVFSETFYTAIRHGVKAIAIKCNYQINTLYEEISFDKQIPIEIKN